MDLIGSIRFGSDRIGSYLIVLEIGDWRLEIGDRSRSDWTGLDQNRVDRIGSDRIVSDHVGLYWIGLDPSTDRKMDWSINRSLEIF